MFFALTLTVIASTLVQVPRSMVNLDKLEVEALARRCVRVARAKMTFVWEVSGSVRHNGFSHPLLIADMSRNRYPSEATLVSLSCLSALTAALTTFLVVIAYL